ncbi:lysozyme inhibitor LprI family protein [Leptospira langatensis]|nr:lysozyme inhibitor LprI family protein [Leptospira langatensis]
MIRYPIFLLLPLFLITLEAKSPNPCSNQKDKAEQKECFQKQYQTADKELNEVYKNVRKSLSDPDKEELKKVQRLWIGYRDGVCEGPMYSSDETGIETISCKADATKARTSYLQKVWIFGKFPKDGLGIYTDGFGGRLRLFRAKGKSDRFQLNVVRGPTAHLGEMDGDWTPNPEGKWTWSSPQNCKAEDPECCILKFQTFDTRIEVEEVACSGFHGARAYFDGDYRYEFK